MADDSKAPPRVRTGQGDVKLSREEFDAARPEFDRVIEVARKVYDEYHKSPRKRKAGPGFQDPDFELPVEWLEAREQILSAERRYRDQGGPSRILLICGAARHDETCPGEMSKTFRLVDTVRATLKQVGVTSNISRCALILG